MCTWKLACILAGVTDFGTGTMLRWISQRRIIWAGVFPSRAAIEAIVGSSNGFSDRPSTFALQCTTHATSFIVIRYSTHIRNNNNNNNTNNFINDYQSLYGQVNMNFVTLHLVIKIKITLSHGSGWDLHRLRHWLFLRTIQSSIDDRAFPVAAARLRNSLPQLVTSAPSLTIFWRRLKTELFIRSCGSD